LQQSNSFGNSVAATQLTEDFFSESTLDAIKEKLLGQADTLLGGFGNAPKFPQTFSIRYLLRHYHAYKDEASLAQALLSLDKMML
ncbi:hypothetical protein ABTE87_21105, partial [Acinetobacter baumannii]